MPSKLIRSRENISDKILNDKNLHRSPQFNRFRNTDPMSHTRRPAMCGKHRKGWDNHKNERRVKFLQNTSGQAARRVIRRQLEANAA